MTARNRDRRGTEALRSEIAAALTAARARTTALTDCVDEADLTRQHSPLMSPLVWDLAHIANQEEMWLLRAVGGQEPIHPEIDPLYDAFEHPRAQRPSLPLLPPREARRYAADVRGRVLDLLEVARFSGPRLVTGGFAYGMIVQHEQQHDETMLITHQLRKGAPVLAAPRPRPRPPTRSASRPRYSVPGGPFTMGTSSEPWALDNERPAHTVQVPSFFIDTTPVTNAAYTAFIADGGYDDPRWWTADGWEHRQRAGLAAPMTWKREGGEWVHTVFGVTEAGPARRAGDARVLVRGGRLRPLGGPAPAHRGGMGKGRAVRPRDGALPPVPVGRRRARAGTRQPGPAAPAARAGRVVPGRGRAVRGAPAHR